MNRKKLLGFLCCMAAVFAVTVLVGCAGDSDSGDHSGNNSGGNETVLPSDDTNVIISDSAIEVALGTDAIPEDALSRLLGNSVKAADVIVDDSAVDYAKAGKYAVELYYKKKVIKTDLYVYGMPTVTATDKTASYEQLSKLDLLEGVTAKDSFGNDLAVSVSETNVTYVDGIIPQGTYSVTYRAEDRVGQAVSVTKNVTMNGTPETVECEDAVLDVALSSNIAYFENGKVFKIICNGETVNPHNYFVDDGYVFLTAQYAYEKNIGEHSFTMYTNYCIADVKVIIVDECDPQFTIAPLENSYMAGEIVFPEIEKLSDYQNYDVKYYVVSGDNETELHSNVHSLYLTGSYKYRVSFERGGHEVYSKSYAFKVFASAAEKDFFDQTGVFYIFDDMTQKDYLPLWRSYQTNENYYIEYDEEHTEGDRLRFHSGNMRANTVWNGFIIDGRVFAYAQDRGYTEFKFTLTSNAGSKGIAQVMKKYGDDTATQLNGIAGNGETLNAVLSLEEINGRDVCIYTFDPMVAPMSGWTDLYISDAYFTGGPADADFTSDFTSEENAKWWRSYQDNEDFYLTYDKDHTDGDRLLFHSGNMAANVVDDGFVIDGDLLAAAQYAGYTKFSFTLTANVGSSGITQVKKQIDGVSTEISGMAGEDSLVVELNLAEINGNDVYIYTANPLANMSGWTHFYISGAYFA